MCGRYSRTADKEALRRRFRLARIEADLFAPRWNLAPSQEALAVVARDGARSLVSMRWGLVPSWAKDARLAPINAKAETLAEKPMFRRLLKSRRCVIPADGFYEWRKLPGQKAKVPYRIELEGRALFSFAGLWDAWISPEGEEVTTFAIVTTEPNAVVAPVHDRMPVILTPEAEEAWLDPRVTDEAALARCLLPYPPEGIRAYGVSTLVNRPENDSAQCVEAVPPPA